MARFRWPPPERSLEPRHGRPLSRFGRPGPVYMAWRCASAGSPVQIRTSIFRATLGWMMSLSCRRLWSAGGHENFASRYMRTSKFCGFGLRRRGRVVTSSPRSGFCCTPGHLGAAHVCLEAGSDRDFSPASTACGLRPGGAGPIDFPPDRFGVRHAHAVTVAGRLPDPSGSVATGLLSHGPLERLAVVSDVARFLRVGVRNSAVLDLQWETLLVSGDALWRRAIWPLCEPEPLRGIRGNSNSRGSGAAGIGKSKAGTPVSGGFVRFSSDCVVVVIRFPWGHRKLRGPNGDSIFALGGTAPSEQVHAGRGSSGPLRNPGGFLDRRPAGIAAVLQLRDAGRFHGQKSVHAP